jgi:hypothetical protein
MFRRSHPPQRHRLRFAIALLLVFAIGLCLALPLLSRTRFVRERVERLAAGAGFEVLIGELRVGYDLALHISNLRVGTGGRPPFVTVEDASLTISLAGLLQRQPFALNLKMPRLYVAHLPAGSDSGNAATIPLRGVVVEDGYIVTAGEETFGPLALSVDAIEAGQQAHLSLEVDPRLPLLDVTGSAHVEAGEIVVDAMQLQWSDVPAALLAERFPAALPAGVTGTLEFTGSASGPLTRLAGKGALEASSVGVIASGLEATAPSCVISGRFERTEGVIGFKGTFNAGGIRSRDATLEHAIENLALSGPLEGSWRPSEWPLLRVDLTAARGEILWRRLYTDLSRYPVRMRGNLRLSPTALEISGLEASVKGLGKLTADGRLSPYTRLNTLDARIEVPELDPLYALVVRDSLRESYPFLNNTAMKGKLHFRGQYRRKKSGSSLSGELQLTGTRISSADPLIEIRGLDVDLPLRLGALSASNGLPGRIRTAGTKLGKLELPATAASLQVNANRIALSEEIRLPLLGGSIRLPEMEAAGLDTAERHVSLAFAVDNVGLTALTEMMGWRPMSGTITGGIPRIVVNAQHVRSEGEIRVQVFEGNVTIRNLHVDQLFTSIPTLGMDLAFDGISLGRLTETLEVGSITGVVRGAVQNLALVDGQPVSFDAWMETVPRPDVPQRVSVAAIRQLSILGGSGSDPFSRGILGLFDEYRYSRMGFRCRLENDKFRLHGVEQSEGKDYLIVGSRLPPRVDVISHNQVVAFSEMVRRLQRIGAAEPDTKKGEPK